jgi:diacylglycerol O-acyltransferase / wax synthase
VHRMSGEDAGFLALELPFQPMHVLVIALVRPPSDGDGHSTQLTLDYVRQHVAYRLGELPSFRWRVVRVPFGLHHPVFIEDADFDLDAHLRHVSLAEPGGPEDLDAFCAAEAEHHLDRRYPLWQLTLVSGLADGRQAVVLRVHHCMMDAPAALVTFERLFSGEDHEVAVAASSWRPDPVPSPSRLIGQALADHRRTIRQAVRVVRKGRRGFAAATNRRRVSGVTVPVSGDAPACSLNRAFSIERTYARTTLSMADVTFVRQAAKVTVNDVALAVAGAALRRYLAARDDLPRRPLVAGVMVGLEPHNAPPRQSGNWISSLTTSLATDVDDPWERLGTIHRVTVEAKRMFALTGPELLPEFLECVPPWVAEPAIRGLHRNRVRHPDKVNQNVVISNFKGPSPPWVLGPAAIEELYWAGPPNSGVGLNVAFSSYEGQLMVGILCFADSIDAPSELAEGFVTSLAELVARAEVITGSKSIRADVAE